MDTFHYDNKLLGQFLDEGATNVTNLSFSAKAMSNIFDQSCLAIVTGTNRGLGKEIVHQLAKRITKPSCIVLISKSPETLKTNSESLRKQFPQHEFCTYACDLGIPSEVTDLISKLSEDLKAKVKQYEAAVLIQNAASLGKIWCDIIANVLKA